MHIYIYIYCRSIGVGVGVGTGGKGPKPGYGGNCRKFIDHFIIFIFIILLLISP